MDLRVLGPIEVHVDGNDVTPTSPNQRIILAVLAAHRDHHVRADTLVDAIWEVDPPPSAERTLRSYISRLRGVMGDSIIASGGGFCLRTDGICLDSAEFEGRLACLRRSSTAVPIEIATCCASQAASPGYSSCITRAC